MWTERPEPDRPDNPVTLGIQLAGYGWETRVIKVKVTAPTVKKTAIRFYRYEDFLALLDDDLTSPAPRYPGGQSAALLRCLIPASGLNAAAPP